MKGLREAGWRREGEADCSEHLTEFTYGIVNSVHWYRYLFMRTAQALVLASVHEMEARVRFSRLHCVHKRIHAKTAPARDLLVAARQGT